MLSLARGPARCTVHGACPTVAQEAGLSPEAAVLSPLGEGARALWPTDNADMSKAHAHGSLALDSHELGSRLSSANSDWLEGGPRMRTPATIQCVHSCSALLPARACARRLDANSYCDSQALHRIQCRASVALPPLARFEQSTTAASRAGGDEGT